MRETDIRAGQVLGITSIKYNKALSHFWVFRTFGGLSSQRYHLDQMQTYLGSRVAYNSVESRDKTDRQETSMLEGYPAYNVLEGPLNSRNRCP